MAHLLHNCAADYNNPDGMDYGEGFKEAQKALDLAQHFPQRDVNLIDAQVHRFTCILVRHKLFSCI